MKTFLLGCLLLIFSLSGLAQTRAVKVVFDVTSQDTLTHQTTLRHVNGMSSAYPDSEFEVVVYGGAIGMVLQDKSTVSEQIKSFAENRNVSFKVCAGTMKRFAVDSTQLLPGVDMVADGILEIVNKQSEGWGYIKESN